MLKVLICGEPGKAFSALDAVANQGDCSRSSAPLSERVALLAVQYGRAPLPVSRGLEKVLMRHGLADDPMELGDLTRRYLFLVEAGILLAESRKRPIPISDSLELVKQLGTEHKINRKPGFHINALRVLRKKQIHQGPRGCPPSCRQVE